MDLEKAFDRVPRELVRWTLRKLGVDAWLIRTVIALYTEACTVVRTDAGLSESFEVTVGLHQGSVLGPLLFAAVMDVVSSEVRGKWPSGVCGKGIQANSVQCTICKKKWIHKRCSGVRGAVTCRG